jgi:hypothetical protein
MLRLALAGALAAPLLAGGPPARAADPDPAAVIARAIEAKGGAAKLEKYRASTATFKGKFYGFGPGIDTAGTLRTMAPDKQFVLSKSKQGGAEDTFVYVVNGDKGWMIFNGNPTELDKDMMAEAREQLHAGAVTELRGLTDKGVKLSPLGETKVGDRAAVGVRVACAGYRDVDLYFDKDKGLLLKRETRGKDPTTGAEYASTTLYDDYKEVGGLMLPHKVDERHDGKPYNRMRLTEIKIEEKLPDSAFAKP